METPQDEASVAVAMPMAIVRAEPAVAAAESRPEPEHGRDEAGASTIAPSSPDATAAPASPDVDVHVQARAVSASAPTRPAHVPASAPVPAPVPATVPATATTSDLDQDRDQDQDQDSDYSDADSASDPIPSPSHHYHPPQHLSLHSRAADQQDDLLPSPQFQSQSQSQLQSHSQSPAQPPSQPPPSPRILPHTRSQTVDAVPPRPLPSSLQGPIKRKPLSSTASPVAVRFSSGLHSPINLPKPDQRFARPFSLDSPTLYEFGPTLRARSRSRSPIPSARLRDTAEQASNTAVDSQSRYIPVQDESHDSTPSTPHTEFSDVLSVYDDLIPDPKLDSEPEANRKSLLEDRSNEKPQSDSEGSEYDYDYGYDDDDEHGSDNGIGKGQAPLTSQPDHLDPATDPPMFASRPSPPHLTLEKVDTSVVSQDPDSARRVETPLSAQPGTSPQINKPLPRSPGQGSPFASLFGWKAASPSATDRSSITSPVSPSRKGTANDTTVGNSLSNGSRTNASDNALDYRASYLSTTPQSTFPAVAQIEEMEDDLKAISAELATSIRREMDLEELAERLQEQINNPQAPGRRTSDYYSDSGTSSAKLSEYDQSREEIEKIQRKSEQEKASLRLELTNKLQDERTKRKELDQHIKELAEKASHIDLAQINNDDASDRVKDLENTCEDLRRRLAEERDAKNNFEDLLSALKGQLQDASNERDNLRDEIVPQLRARVEGLETEAAEYANLTYESTKMQQQLQSLMKENDTLRHTAKSGAETPPDRMSRTMSGSFGGGLARSNSVATSSFRNQRPPNLTLSRSNSFKGNQVEPREVLAERLKDVEAQRDALHRALKNLLERQEFQNRENEKRIRILEHERERLLSTSPRKGGFAKEVSSLRTEIAILRRRAEEALEQKWEVEKGLGGLKMDLDRAEEEIALLRDLLSENDILIPPLMARSSGSSSASGSQGSFGAPVTSESLENAYKELQAAYTESLERIKKLEAETGSDVADEKTQLAIERLERSLSAAVSERDAAKQEVEMLRGQNEDFALNEGRNLESERALADELSESARRVEELASQVRKQLSTNAELRQRLSDTVVRGDNDRKTNSDRIANLQIRLKELEDQLIAAQSASEERLARHEEEVAALREAHNQQLSRMGSATFLGLRSPGFKSPRKSPLLSPMASPMFPRSPRMPQTKSFEDEAQVKTLRDRVAELEKAIVDTESEMSDVVARMSTAQIEVLGLQEERDAAVRETRRLQKIVEQEQAKSFEERFRTLSGRV